MLKEWAWEEAASTRTMVPVWDFAIAYFKKLYRLSYFFKQFIKTTSTLLVELLVEPKKKNYLFL
jgi:hypothetical protein